MDLNLDAESRILRESARAFLSRACGADHVRAMESDASGFDRDLWRRAGELGWAGMILPERFGGAGRTFLDLAILLEECGRVLLPSPLFATAAVAAPLVERIGSEEDRARWLPDLASGRRIAVLALVEPGWRDEWGPVASEARSDGDGLRVTGAKLFVPFAAEADFLLVAAREGQEIAIALVERRAAGVSCERLATLDGGHRYEVRFDDAPGHRLGVPGAGAAAALESARQRAAVATLAAMTGAAERVLEMSVEYARTRVQFGRPIGAFQAVAHRCADMRSDVDALRILVWQASWRLSRQPTADLEIGIAKAFGSEALRRIARDAHQVHGAIGFSTECDLQLFTRRMKAAELEWGSASAHRERVARAIGL